MGLRHFLNKLYTWCGLIAGFFLILICAVVSIQFLIVLINRLLLLVNLPTHDFVIPSYAQLCGFFLAASTFFGLTYALSTNEHVRVGLIRDNIAIRYKNLLDICTYLIAVVFSAIATWAAINLVLSTYSFGDKTYGSLSIPIFIPQISMAIGLLMLTICLLDGMISKIYFSFTKNCQANNKYEPGENI